MRRVTGQHSGTRYVVWLGVPLVKRLTGHQAITIYDVVFVGPRQWSARALAHEVAHVRQWKRYGVFGFLRRYLNETRKHGYRGNGLEVAARLYADAYAHKFAGLP
jgi:hypothetical protein